MYLINRHENRIQKLDKKTFSRLDIRERENLQEWIAHDPLFFGEDDEMLFIQKEFDGFDDTRERLDLLALDKFGNIVVIENKLDDSGKDVIWQVLKYASYCASLTKLQIVNIFQQYLDRCCMGENAETRITEFFDVSDISEVEINTTQRIILVSGNFRKEVTSTVLWLLNNYKMNIKCFKVTPFSLGETSFLNVEQILPIKEVEEYTIRMAEKKLEEADTQQELKARHSIRIEFWKQLLAKINNTDLRLFQNVSPSKDNWISGGTGMNGVPLTFVVSRNYARTELYINQGDEQKNKMVFDLLYVQKEKIETAFGGNLTWERLDGKVTSRVKNEIPDVSLYEKDDWGKMTDFMIDSMIRMEKAFKRPLMQIKQELRSER